MFFWGIRGFLEWNGGFLGIKRECFKKAIFKQFTPSIMYCRGGKFADSGLLRQIPGLFANDFFEDGFFEFEAGEILFP
jgi:hypothetical protein